MPVTSVSTAATVTNVVPEWCAKKVVAAPTDTVVKMVITAATVTNAAQDSSANVVIAVDKIRTNASRNGIAARTTASAAIICTATTGIKYAHRSIIQPTVLPSITNVAVASSVAILGS